MSAGELSSDSLPTGRASRGSGSHSSPSVLMLQHYQGPTASSLSLSDDDFDDDDEEFNPGPTTAGGGDSVPHDS